MLTTKVFTKSKKDLKRFRKHVDIGFLNSLSPEVIMKAAVNEFGTDKIPERSFMRSTIDENKDKILKYVKKMAPGVLIGAIPENDFMRKIGVFVKDLITYKIATAKSWATALSVVTIQGKGHDRPLIDTYEMITSIDIKVQ